MITYAEAQAYERDGFVLIPDLFSRAEIQILLDTLAAERVAKHTFNMPDTAGRNSRLALWGDVGDDVFGAVSASPRIVDSVRALLQQDIYHWHSKVMLKEARVGGAWEWHQDYGYWYGDGLLYPDLVSCMVALDPATKANGCLKVLVGSHRLGRIEHGQRGNQSGANPERVAEIAKRLPVHYVEAPPGSALFFHCNLLHASEANLSEHPRRAYICCYNAMANTPMTGFAGHGQPISLQAAPDDAILRHGTAAGAKAPALA